MTAGLSWRHFHNVRPGILAFVDKGMDRPGLFVWNTITRVLDETAFTCVLLENFGKRKFSIMSQEVVLKP